MCTLSCFVHHFCSGRTVYTFHSITMENTNFWIIQLLSPRINVLMHVYGINISCTFWKCRRMTIWYQNTTIDTFNGEEKKNYNKYYLLSISIMSKCAFNCFSSNFSMVNLFPKYIPIRDSSCILTDWDNYMLELRCPTIRTMWHIRWILKCLPDLRLANAYT